MGWFTVSSAALGIGPACGQIKSCLKAHLLIVYELMEEADGVGAAAHAGQQHVRLAAELLQALPPHLLADDGLKVSHLHHRRRSQLRNEERVAYAFGQRTNKKMRPDYGCHQSASGAREQQATS